MPPSDPGSAAEYSQLVVDMLALWADLDHQDEGGWSVLMWHDRPAHRPPPARLVRLTIV